MGRGGGGHSLLWILFGVGHHSIPLGHKWRAYFKKMNPIEPKQKLYLWNQMSDSPKIRLQIQFVFCLRTWKRKLINLDHEETLECIFSPRIPQNQPPRVHFFCPFGGHIWPGESTKPLSLYSKKGPLKGPLGPIEGTRLVLEQGSSKNQNWES